MAKDKDLKPNKTKKSARETLREQIKARLLEAPDLSSRYIARSFGVSPSTVISIRSKLPKAVQIRTVASNNEWMFHPYFKDRPELLKKFLVEASDRTIRALQFPGVLDKMMKTGSISPVYTQTLLNREAKETRKNAIYKLSEGDCHVFCADILKDSLIKDVPNKSVELMLVDPVYSFAYLPTLSAISALAKRVLRDDGNLLVLYGNSHLPEAIKRLGEHMNYHWTLAYMTPAGGSPPLQYVGVATHWKPVLWYRKRKNPYKGGIIYDVVDTGKPLKTAEKTHIFEQDLQGMMHLIERFSDPGQTVLDCNCGSGVVGEACIRLGRKAILCDIDPQAVEQSRSKITQALIECNDTRY